jgi:hypothetical protein
MRIELSLAFAFKLFVLLFAVGLIGAALSPARPGKVADDDRRPPGPTNAQSPTAPASNVAVETGPMTRAVLEGIYFDVVRANGQGDHLQIELRVFNTGPDRKITPGRAKGILEPALFATVFDEQGRKWYADQVQIANVTSTSGYLPETKLVSGVPTSMLLTFARMPAIAGVLQIRTIPQLEVPVIVAVDEPQSAAGQGNAVMLVFRQIPVERR